MGYFHAVQSGWSVLGRYVLYGCQQLWLPTRTVPSTESIRKWRRNKVYSMNQKWVCAKFFQSSNILRFFSLDKTKVVSSDEMYPIIQHIQFNTPYAFFSYWLGIALIRIPVFVQHSPVGMIQWALLCEAPGITQASVSTNNQIPIRSNTLEKCLNHLFFPQNNSAKSWCGIQREHSQNVSRSTKEMYPLIHTNVIFLNFVMFVIFVRF